jgi:hypothetical protein
VIFNEAVTALSVIKAVVDVPLCKYDSTKKGENGPFLEKWNAASPIVEFVIDGIWMVPTFGPLCRKTDTSIRLAVAGGVLFNFGGMCALPLSFKGEPVWETSWMIAMMVLTLGYGCLMGAASEAGGIPLRIDEPAV